MSTPETTPSPVRLVGAPEHDPPGTVRVHPEDDPARLDARRMILSALGNAPDDVPWLALSCPGPPGPGVPGWAPHAYVDDWPVQPLWHLVVVLGHEPALEAAANELEVDYGRGWRTPPPTHQLVAGDVDCSTADLRAEVRMQECGSAFARGQLDRRLHDDARGDA